SEETFRRNPHAPFALDGLDHDRRGFIVDQFFNRFQVTKRSVRETSHQRAKSFMILRLRGGGSRSQGSSMKPAQEGDNFVFLFGRVQSGKFNRRFVGFGSGV